MGVNAGFVSILKLLPKLLAKEVILGKSSSASPSDSVTLNNTFIQECIKLAFTRRLCEIKFKGRIPLPGCWNLVGVIDEDDFLEEGEIYACIRREDLPDLYLEGSIAISRSPTMAPGDLQSAVAIGKPRRQDAPHLRGLFNCVVFSREGTRSLPSCLAGGDLDGDLYLLITNSDLIPTHFERPSDYASPVVRKLDRIATVDDGSDFFIHYPLCDLTGNVATKHFIIADQSPTGVLDERCQVLAKAHSDAVDYAKSGIPVNRKFLPRGDSSQGRPDFLQPEFGSVTRQDSSEYYMSDKILGQLYRNIQLDPVYTPASRSIDLDSDGLLSSSIMSFFNEQNLGLPNVELIDHLSKEVLPRYSKSLALLSQAYSLSSHISLSEEEVFIGYITTCSGRDKKVRENMITKLAEETSSLFSQFKKEISGTDINNAREIVRRAWTVWWICKSENGFFGRRILGFLAYGIMIRLANK